MLKFIKRILLFITLIVFYYIFKEFVVLYVSLNQIHPYLGYGFILLFLTVFIYLVLIPIYKILKIPNAYSPTKNKNKELTLIKKRLELFRENPYITKQGYVFDLVEPQEDYNNVIKLLSKEAKTIRRKYVSQLFYGTAIAQNGFIDTILILSASVNLIKEIFILYNGRVSNKDLLIIAKQVYYSMAIGGSYGVEYATDELFSKLSSDTIKSIPFIDKIITSIADGLVNAALLTRVALITENYCKLTYIKSDKDLYPSNTFILKSMESITSDILRKISISLRKIALEKTISFASIAINPAGYVIGNIIEKKALNDEKLTEEEKENRIETAKIIRNPLYYGISKLFHGLKKK